MAAKTAPKTPSERRTATWKPRICHLCEQPIEAGKDAMRVLRLSYPEGGLRRYRFWAHRGCIR